MKLEHKYGSPLVYKGSVWIPLQLWFLIQLHFPLDLTIPKCWLFGLSSNPKDLNPLSSMSSKPLDLKIEVLTSFLESGALIAGPLIVFFVKLYCGDDTVGEVLQKNSSTPE